MSVLFKNLSVFLRFAFVLCFIFLISSKTYAQCPAKYSAQYAFAPILAQCYDANLGGYVSNGILGSLDYPYWFQYTVDFGNLGANKFTAHIAVNSSFVGRKISLRLKNGSGAPNTWPIIGTITTTIGASNWSTYQDLSLSFAPIKGVQVIALTVDYGSAAGNLDYFKFTQATSSSSTTTTPTPTPSPTPTPTPTGSLNPLSGSGAARAPSPKIIEVQPNSNLTRMAPFTFHASGIAGNEVYPVDCSTLPTVNCKFVGDGPSPIYEANEPDQVNPFYYRSTTDLACVLDKTPNAPTSSNPLGLSNYQLNQNRVNCVNARDQQTASINLEQTGSGTPLTAHYEWDFDDCGYGPCTSGQAFDSNRKSLSNFNYLEGWNAAHTFDKPGQYTITLRITNDHGLVGQTTSTITVSKDTRTNIYISNSANSSTDQPYSPNTKAVGSDPNRPISFARASRYLNDLASSSCYNSSTDKYTFALLSDGTYCAPTRLIFRRGDTFTYFSSWNHSSTPDLYLHPSSPDVVLTSCKNFSSSGMYDCAGDYSPASNYSTLPVLSKTEVGNDLAEISPQGSTHDIVIENLAFNPPNSGPQYNSSGQSFFPKLNMNAIVIMAAHVTVRNNYIVNIDDFVHPMEGHETHGILVQHNITPTDTSIRGYFVWVASQNIVVLDNTVLNSTREHLIRASDPNAEKILISHNTLQMDRPANDAGAEDKCTINIRQGARTYITQNQIKGGSISFSEDAWVVYGDSENTFTLLERNIISSWATLQFGQASKHNMVRNNIFVFGGPGPQIQIMRHDYSTAWPIQDVSILNNTSILQSGASTFLDIEVDKPSLMQDAVTVANNLVSATVPYSYSNRDKAIQIISPDSSTTYLAQSIANIWPAPSSSSSLTTNYYGYNTEISFWKVPGFATMTQWNTLPHIGGDLFQSISVNSSNFSPASCPASSGRTLPAGVFNNFYGQPRSTYGSCWAGAY